MEPTLGLPEIPKPKLNRGEAFAIVAGYTVGMQNIDLPVIRLVNLLTGAIIHEFSFFTGRVIAIEPNPVDKAMFYILTRDVSRQDQYVLFSLNLLTGANQTIASFPLVGNIRNSKGILAISSDGRYAYVPVGSIIPLAFGFIGLPRVRLNGYVFNLAVIDLNNLQIQIQPIPVEFIATIPRTHLAVVVRNEGSEGPGVYWKQRLGLLDLRNYQFRELTDTQGLLAVVSSLLVDPSGTYAIYGDRVENAVGLLNLRGGVHVDDLRSFDNPQIAVSNRELYIQGDLGDLHVYDLPSLYSMGTCNTLYPIALLGTIANPANSICTSLAANPSGSYICQTYNENILRVIRREPATGNRIIADIPIRGAYLVVIGSL